MMKKLPYIVLSVCILVVIVVVLVRFVLPPKSDSKIITTSTLIEAVDIATLSVAEIKYSGIAKVYNDEEKNNLKCQVCYSAVVKAGIDEAIDIEVDDENKTVTAKLPEIKLSVYIDENQPMTVIPSGASVELPEMLKCCKEDAELEARESDELMTTARDGLRDTVARLLLPLLEPQGYKLLPIQ